MSFSSLFSTAKATTPATPETGFSKLFATLPPKELAQKQNSISASANANQAQAESAQANSLGGIAKNTISDINSKLPPVAIKSWNPIDWFTGAAKDLKGSVDTLVNQGFKTGETLFNPKSSLLDKTVDVGQTGMDVVNLGIGAVMSPLSAASHIPVVGYAVDGLNKLFGVLSQGGSNIAGGTVDLLPVSQQTKDKIKPLVQEIGALGAQILAGKVVFDKVAPLIKDKSVQIVDSVKTDPSIVEHITPKTETPTEIPVKTEVKPTETPVARQERLDNYISRVVSMSKGMGDTAKIIKEATKKFNEANPVEEVKTTPKVETTTISKIQVEPNAKNLLDEHVKINPDTNTNKIITDAEKFAKNSGKDKIGQVEILESLGFNKLTKLPPKESPAYQYYKDAGVLEKPKTLSIEAKTVNTASKEIVGEGKQVTSTRSDTLLKSAVEKKLTDTVEQSGTHTQIDTKDQASKAVDYINKNPDYMDVAMGRKAHPQAEAIYTAAEIKAIQEGNIEAIRELAKSEVPTHAGQALKALDSADPNSPVKIMRDIRNAREAAAEKKTGKKVSQAKKSITDEIKSEIKKKAPTKQTVAEFIKELSC